MSYLEQWWKRWKDLPGKRGTTAAFGRDVTGGGRWGGPFVTEAANPPLFGGYRAAPATKAATM